MRSEAERSGGLCCSVTSRIFTFGMFRVGRRRLERQAHCTVMPTVAGKGGSVMIWGGITAGGGTRLVFVDGLLAGQRYRDEILGPHVLPSLRQMNIRQPIYEDGNAWPHRAAIVNLKRQHYSLKFIEIPCNSFRWDLYRERGERIKAVIENIRTRSKKLKKKALVPATKKVSEPKEKEKMDAAGQEKRKQKPSGRHTMYKLHIGWRHYCQGDFRQITSRRGGGIRKMEYNITEPQDIKPENILLTRNLETAKLCDMGLSKVKVMNTMTKTVADRRETQPGTPAYQAPEILLQARRGRTQADVWSLCCSLVELFTAKTIWDLTSEDDENDDSVQVIIRAMQRKDMPHGLSNLDREHTLSVQLKAVIQKGLSYQIEDRPTALDFVVALKHEL
ncbi:MHK-like protein [Mya arenaria]|uniref:MHK-like protein n=1 Tax=Mya arenaria TaxID=6604 RepID=A0ABY7FT68_MYAAR|nr:MHK-like protein [Mya arenaria]